jgi:predicted nucleotidyltransferase
MMDEWARVSASENVATRSCGLPPATARATSCFSARWLEGNTPESDVDFLVDITGDTTPWFPGGLIADLEQLLGQRVQVVIRRSLSPLIRDDVLREVVPL